MFDAIEEMKVRAGLLHKKTKLGDAEAIRRTGRGPDDIQRKHCLDVIARDFGFDDFRHARRVIDAEGATDDFGRLLYRSGNHGSLNHWYAHYEQARAHQKADGGYLLPYRRQFMVVSHNFVRDLGLDPEDAAWKRMQHDWVKPAEPAARRELYGRLVAQAPLEKAA